MIDVTSLEHLQFLQHASSLLPLHYAARELMIHLQIDSFVSRTRVLSPMWCTTRSRRCQRGRRTWVRMRPLKMRLPVLHHGARRVGELVDGAHVSGPPVAILRHEHVGMR